MATLTVGDVTPRVQYTATGSQTVFAYSFPIFVDSDLKVYIGSTLKSLTTHYTVSGAGTTAGGNVTLGTGATAGDIVTIYRDLPVSRTTDYQTGGDLLAETLNDDLDKVVMMAQQNERDLNNRTLRFGQFTTGIPLAEFTESATDRANKVLAFDSSGDPTITLELGTFQGNWATSTAYVIRDLVKDTSNNNVYICVTAHTSSGAQPISSNTDAAKWSLIVDAASATSSASAAATSATNAATSATNAATSATNSATSATSSASSATTATTQASAASTSATNAATSATAAAASYDSFDDRYLGTKSSDPTVDNDSNALLTGALYWNSTAGNLNVWDGSAWVAIQADTDVKVLVSSNDTTAGYLNGKLVAGSNVTLTEGSDGGNETLSIASTDTDTTYSAGATLSLATTTFSLNLANANEWTKTQNFNSTSLTFDATQDWDLAANQVCDLTLTANTTFDAPTNMMDGGFYSITLIQDGTGSRTASWNTVFKWAAGTAPTLTTTASAKDIVVFRSDGTNMLEVGRQLNLS
tara:strand:- start:639 stop:2216 length:1578 start_codon:yes stop_codon:yes gene_type:complete